MQILHIVLNEFVNDRRVERAVGVAGAFGTVHVYALHREGLAEAVTCPLGSIQSES